MKELYRLLIGLAFGVVLGVFLAPVASAQGITDCKACGVTCSSTAGCYQNCIRMTKNDCANFGMECYGVCYTFFDYTYVERQCRVDSWYPCYA